MRHCCDAVAEFMLLEICSSKVGLGYRITQMKLNKVLKHDVEY